MIPTPLCECGCGQPTPKRPRARKSRGEHRRFVSHSHWAKLPRKPVERRFWEKVDKRSIDECWPWKASTGRGGYGHFPIGRTHQLAHRVSWELSVGPLPQGMWVLHHCDVPSCVNPLHLYLGMHAENMRDRAVRKRQSGEKSAAAKLTWPQVREMRRLRLEGATMMELQGRFGLHNSQICRIVNGKYWKE